MTLENLQKEMIQAMRNKDTIRKSVLSSAVSAVKNAAIAKQCRDNIDESLVNEVLLKEKKTLLEQIETCPVDRTEKRAEYKEKLAILEEYCPKLLDDPVKIADIIQCLCFDAGVDLLKSNRGNVMKIVMPHFKGHADMKVVNQVVGGLLK
jgi:uncharacterized protein YqeY